MVLQELRFIRIRKHGVKQLDGTHFKNWGITWQVGRKD